MSMPRPPLSDIDYTAACETAAKLLCQLHTDIVFGVAPTEQGCRDWCDERPRYEPVHRHVTEWQPIEEAIP